MYVKHKPGLVRLPSVRLKPYVTSDGLKIWVPVEGNQLWASPLLTTPHPSPNLSLRNREDVSAGFVSNGPWEPYGYPHVLSGYRRHVEEQLSSQTTGRVP